MYLNDNYTNDNGKKDGLSCQKQHIHAIKERLSFVRKLYDESHNTRVTDYALNKYINTKTSLYCTIPTIKKMFTPEVDVENEAISINITLIIELCHFFKVDSGYILALPEENINFVRPPKYGIKQIPLEDSGYLGHFNCYRLSTSSASGDISSSTKNDTLRENDHINHSTLDIDFSDGMVNATMITHNMTEYVDGQLITKDLELSGTPILYLKSNNIHIDLTSKDGEIYTLFFDYQPFDSGIMYYREAILLSSTKGTRSLPLVSKMIITRNPIPESEYPKLRGLLSLNVNTVIISEDKLKELSSEDELVKQFCEDFKTYFPIWKRNFCIIPENIVQNNHPNSTLSKLEIQKALLSMRNHSYSMAQIIVGDSYKASVIGKEIQMQQ